MDTYLAVDDADATVAKVSPAGGQVLMPAVDIGEAGRMAFVADPTGATVGLWQANRHIGATLVNEPGALVWNELLTDKPDSALAFYEAVLGLTHSTMEMAPGQTSECSMSADPVLAAAWNRRCPACRTNGVSTSPSTTPTPPRQRRAADGGQIVAAPFDIPSVGRCAVLTDPQGATFSVMRLASN